MAEVIHCARNAQRITKIRFYFHSLVRRVSARHAKALFHLFRFSIEVNTEHNHTRNDFYCATGNLVTGEPFFGSFSLSLFRSHSLTREYIYNLQMRLNICMDSLHDSDPLSQQPKRSRAKKHIHTTHRRTKTKRKSKRNGKKREKNILLRSFEIIKINNKKPRAIMAVFRAPDSLAHPHSSSIRLSLSLFATESGSQSAQLHSYSMKFAVPKIWYPGDADFQIPKMKANVLQCVGVQVRVRWYRELTISRSHRLNLKCGE